MRYCVVNGDDFGASRGVNRGIVEAHDAGIVTSTSLMVNMPATEEAVRLARARPRLGVGLHVNVTFDGGDPIVPLDDPAAFAAELDRQIERFVALIGRSPTHLDAHHNIHRYAPLTPFFQRAADRVGVPLREHGPVRYFGSFYAQWDGETHPEQVTVEMLRSMIAGFPEGFTELSCHPGYVDDQLGSIYAIERELELATLLDPRTRAAFYELGVLLVNYEDVLRLRAHPARR